MREYTEKEYRNVLGQKLQEVDFIEEKMQQTYSKIKKQEERKKNRRKTKFLAGLSAVAASLVMLITFCAANPALAAKLPIMGSFFKDVEEKVSYKGDYSSRSEKLIPESSTETGTEESVTDSPYIQAGNGVTITLGEVYCNDMALYLGIQIQKDEPLSQESIEACTYADGVNRVSMVSTLIVEGQESGGSDIYMCPNSMEGSFDDEYTFTGILRVDAQDFVEELTPGYDGLIDGENWGEHFKRVDIPDNFSCQLNIEEIFGEYDENYKKTGEVRGPWNFAFDVKKDTSDFARKEINEANENGIGVKAIIKSPYEMKGELLLPEGENEIDYVIAICDAQGKPLDRQGSFEAYGIYNRDISKITVYVCYYDTYMDECKGENYVNLPKKALFSTEVSFEE